MSCDALQQGSLAEYYCGTSFVPCQVLSVCGRLCLVQFRTADWGAAYSGYSVYATVALFAEHLRPAEQRPQSAEAIDQAASWRGCREKSPDIPCRSQPPRKVDGPIGSSTSMEKREGLVRNGPGQTPALAKSGQPEPKLNGKQVYAGVKFPTRSPARVRTISGLTLKDFSVIDRKRWGVLILHDFGGGISTIAVLNCQNTAAARAASFRQSSKFTLAFIRM